MKTDIELHADVLKELAWDPRVRENEIGVVVNGGIVRLGGSVGSYAEKTTAERIVEHVAGVRAVANELRVAIPEGAGRTDAAIARQVVDSLAWDVQIPADRITSVVSDGWVTLSGDVDWRYQRDAAGRAIRNLAGVRGVTNDIAVTPNAVSPADVSRDIKQALERRADRTADNIIVETRDGVVTLTGTVSSFGDRRAAEGAAWSAPGVTDVKDEIAVML
jgi:osmotically-inducible protein OsmY